MWTSTFSPMTIAEAKLWLDPMNFDTPTLGDYISALKGVENKSLHEIHGHLDVSEALAELALIDAMPGSHNEKLPRTNRLDDALKEIAAGPAATEHGHMDDHISGADLVEELTATMPTDVLNLLELGRTIARLETEGALTVAKLAEDFIDPDVDLDGVEDQVVDGNPLTVLRAYLSKLTSTL